MKQTVYTILSIVALWTMVFFVPQNLRAEGVVRYVKEGATGDGSSWDKASGDLQAMIDASNSGDEVWVAQGSYQPKKLLKSTKKRSFAFTLKNGVSLYGGFAGNEASKADRAQIQAQAPLAFAFKHATILDADIDDMADDWQRKMGDGSLVRYQWDIVGNEKNANHILYSPKDQTITDKIEIDGFTLQGGYADVWNVEAAGAALHAKGYVVLRNSIVRRNASYTRVEADKEYKGGAVYLDGKNAEIVNCLFEDNYTSMPTLRSYGGSVYMNGGKISQSLFKGSVSLDEGGAIAIVGGSVSNCHFYDCYAAVGGAIKMEGSQIENCFIAHSRSLKGGGIAAIGGKIHHTTITNCYSDDPSFGDAGYGRGGGIYALDNCQIIGSIVTHCTAGQGGGVFLHEGSKLYHSTLFANAQRHKAGNPNLYVGEAAIEKNNIVDANTASSHFVKPNATIGFSEESKAQERKLAQEADYALASGSTFIATGEIVAGVTETIDMRGNQRLNAEGKIDRGALAFVKNGSNPGTDPQPNITLTFREGDRNVTIGTGGGKGTSFQVDFGNGKLENYEGAKVITKAIQGKQVKIYGDDLLILLVNNQGLEAIDLSGAKKLMKLQLIGNHLKKLDLSHSPNLYQVYCESNEIDQPVDFSAQTRMNVISIQRNYFSGKLDLKHIEGLTSLLCYNNRLTEIALPTNTSKLTSIACDSNHLTTLDVSACSALQDLSCADNLLTKLDVKSNPNLTKIYAINNQIAEIDLSNNKELETLTLTNNKLSSINLSENKKLKDLYLGSNQLSRLDLSANPLVEWLIAENNHLTELNTNLQKNIRMIKVSDNRLASLDLKENSALSVLWFGGNEFKSIDLSHQASLIWLVCPDNRLTTLNLASNPNIAWLECENNQLETLDLSHQKNLQKLFAHHNRLASITWGNKKALQGIRVENNQLSTEQLDKLLADLPNVSAVELNDNNRDWAKKIDISENPGTEKAQTQAAQALGWEVTATTNIENILDAHRTIYYDQEGDAIVLLDSCERITILDASGSVIWSQSAPASRISMQDLPQGSTYIAVAWEKGIRKNVCTFTK